MSPDGPPLVLHPEASVWTRRCQGWKGTADSLSEIQIHIQDDSATHMNTLSSVKEERRSLDITPDHMRAHTGVILKC